MRIPVCLIAFVVSMAASPAWASPVDLFGFGARGVGLAGTIVSMPRGFESIYYNPSGLAFERRASVGLGYQFGALHLEVDGQEVNTRDIPALTIGFAVPLPLGGPLAERLSLGLGFVIPQTSILVTDIERPSEPSFPVLANRAQTVSIQAALGIRITDWLAVGVGTIALAALDGEIIVEPNAAGRIGSRVRDELMADYALVAGALVRPLDNLQFGIQGRTESKADFNLPLRADLGEQFTIPIPTIEIRGTAQYDPAQVTFEASGRPLPWLTVAAGIRWENWATFPMPIAYSAVPEGTAPQPKPNFHDTIAFNLGIELDLELAKDVHLLPRCGFRFEPSPAPAQTGFHNHLDSDRAIGAIGLGLRWGQFRFDMAGQYHDLATRKHTKVAGTPDTNPGFPTIEGSGHLLMGSFELGIEL